MTDSRIFLSPPHLSGKEERAIKEAIASNWIAPLGPHVDAFEKEMATFTGVKSAVAVSSGTAAIHLALDLLGVKEGDKVFCSTLTFVASANPILYQGAEPVFIDSEPASWNISPRALKKAFQDSAQKGTLPKAVIVVNLYGQSAKMDEIIALCNQYDVPMIEDAAESLGTIYRGAASGSFGRFGIFSFNGNKIITTSGGGMLVSNDEAAMERARFLASQARDPAPHYQHSVKGYNYRISNLLASVGRAQLEVLEKRIAARRSIFDIYYHSLSDVPGITFMPELKDTKTNRWLSVMLINETEARVTVSQLLQALHRQNIEARPVWKPLHLQPLFKGAAYYSHRTNEHVAESLFAAGICLPSGSNLTIDQQIRVITCIRQMIEGDMSKRSYLILGKHEV
ncbi:DegT/DnrJ/EryC1/StrS family aminotransferase [Lentibacillus sediminis]|uniref:DegT/DnrJ/EryC1/StrS family aminotransferase n=1 Tax=Lentibacillus sediminis TaxID=1940529 RepID=UPI000C1C51C5|nr:aminotransferase class I/II-fold pyridoxal phosphate-dependent enzyme [Lentibacillus sediminis]